MKKKFMTLFFVLSLFIFKSNAVLVQNDTDIDLEILSMEGNDRKMLLSQKRSQKLLRIVNWYGHFIFEINGGKQIHIRNKCSTYISETENSDNLHIFYSTKTKKKSKEPREIIVTFKNEELSRLPVEYFRDKDYEKACDREREEKKNRTKKCRLVGTLAVCAPIIAFALRYALTINTNSNNLTMPCFYE